MSAKRPTIEIGYRIGMLTVAETTDRRKNGYTVWRCKCECGGTIDLDTRCLQRGTVTDCGCLSVVRPGMLDLTGQRFGKLVCLRLTDEKDSRGGTQWECRCDCGEICTASLHQLRAGYKKSCGCLGTPPLKDYIGRKFHKLTVVDYDGKRNGMHYWKCRCDCSGEVIVGQTLLQSGHTKSCGCMVRAKKTEDYESAFQAGLVDGTSVSVLEARMSKPPIASNTSGHNGVYQIKSSGKWAAQITFKKKTYYLGSYHSIEDAIKARKRGEEVYDDFLSWYYMQRKKRSV